MKQIQGKQLLLRDRSLICIPGGGGGGGGGGLVVGEKVKKSPFLGGKFFTGKKHEGVKFYDTATAV